VDDSYSGVVINSNNSLIQYNLISTLGYKGIGFNGSNVEIANNLVNGFCMTKDDGGGIYTWANNGDTYYTNRYVHDNIVINSIGAAAGSVSGTTESHGIYADGGAMNIYFYRNTIAFGSPSDAGVFGNSILLNTFRLNKIYSVDIGYQFNKQMNDQNLVRQITFASNIVYPNIENYQYWNGALNGPIQTDMRAVFTKLDSNFYRSDVIG